MHLNSKTFGYGRPIVLLHGLFGSGDNLRTVASNLAIDHTVWLPDARNHGDSPHTSEMSYDLMAKDLWDFFQENQIPRASIVGHSMGGKTAMRFALQFPALVDRLVGVDIAPRQSNPAHLEILEALQKLDLKAFAARREIEASLASSIPSLGTRRFLLKSLGRNAEGKFCWKLNLAAIAGQYPNVLAEVTSTGALPFTGPTLFVRGALSDYLTDADRPQIQQWFPAAQIKSVAGAGHWVHADATDAFLKILRGFLD